MFQRPKCRCPLCLIDRKLRTELFDASNQDRQRIALRSLPYLSGFDTAAEVLTHLQSAQANAETDAILSELLTLKTRFPDSNADSLLVLVFLPVLHSTVRQVRRHYPVLSREDVAQQAISALLDFLDSPRLRARQTYLAFAVSRRVRRATFGWAAKEARSALENYQLNGTEETYLFQSAVESFERASSLRHFLSRALVTGTLRSAELDLLIQFKLEGGAESGAFSNAERQRLKRLVAKLRNHASGQRPKPH